jgi:hypothetical protein
MNATGFLLKSEHGNVVDEAENEAVVLLEKRLQRFHATRARRLFVGHTASNERSMDLTIEVIAVGHQQEREPGRAVIAAYVLDLFWLMQDQQLPANRDV